MSNTAVTLGYIIEGEKEIAGSYVHALPLDDLVRLHVKAFGFEVNMNRFMFKRGPLEASHATKFGTTIPAFKTFEGKLVNRNHWMTDQGSYANHPIGFIERSYLKPDGVYLDLILWKRTLSDSELSQLRTLTANVSMEVEYNFPRMIVNGIEQPLDPKRAGGKQVVRTMSDNSILSFVGIAVLFNGIKPGDQNSGIRVVENAAYHEGVTLERTTNTVEISSVSTPEGETMEIVTIEQFQALQSELATAKAQIQEQAASLEQSAVSKQELEAQVADRDNKLQELYATQDAYLAAQQELERLREQSFMESLAKCFDLKALESDELSFVKSMCSDLYGCSDMDSFMDKASLILSIAAAATSEAVAYHAEEAEEDAPGETSTAQATEETTPAPEVTENTEEPVTEAPVTEETSTEEAPAAEEVVTVTEEAPAEETVVETSTEVEDPAPEEELALPATEQATVVTKAPSPAPSIAGNSRSVGAKTFTRRHLTFN